MILIFWFNSLQGSSFPEMSSKHLTWQKDPNRGNQGQDKIQTSNILPSWGHIQMATWHSKECRRCNGRKKEEQTDNPCSKSKKWGEYHTEGSKLFDNLMTERNETIWELITGELGICTLGRWIRLVTGGAQNWWEKHGEKVKQTTVHESEWLLTKTGSHKDYSFERPVSISLFSNWMQ